MLPHQRQLLKMTTTLSLSLSFLLGPYPWDDLDELHALHHPCPLSWYLTEEIEGDEAYFKSGDLTVLGWWKRRSPAFPVLSLVARDILAI
nr:zinc finger BED domain-containing protein RICESLEEPER 2-like [Tanacetum cinerariifolium]